MPPTARAPFKLLTRLRRVGRIPRTVTTHPGDVLDIGALGTEYRLLVVTRMRRAPIRFAVVGLVVVALAGVDMLVIRAGGRSAGPAAGPPVVLHSAFQPVRSGVYGVLASGDYVLSTIGDGLSQGPVVTDDRTSVTTPLYQGCYVVGLGDPWLLMGCPRTSSAPGGYGLQLYSLPTEAREPVSDNPNLPYSPWS
jgi:hypothetical protein